MGTILQTTLSNYVSCMDIVAGDRVITLNMFLTKGQ